MDIVSKRLEEDDIYRVERDYQPPPTTIILPDGRQYAMPRHGQYSITSYSAGFKNPSQFGSKQHEKGERDAEGKSPLAFLPSLLPTAFLAYQLVRLLFARKDHPRPNQGRRTPPIDWTLRDKKDAPSSVREGRARIQTRQRRSGTAPRRRVQEEEDGFNGIII